MIRRLVLFDIDGTLLLSQGAGRRAILEAMGDLLPPPGGGERVRFDGKTDPQIVVELLALAGVTDPADPVRVGALLDRYVSCLEAELGRHDHQTRLMPGVPAVLDRIEAEDGSAVLGLLTGNVATGARLKLESAGLAPDRFRVGAFGSDHAERPELAVIAAARAAPLFGRAPVGHEVVIIGDTPADVTCGVGIGARSIGVATGSYAANELKAAGAWAVFEDLSDVEAVLDAVWRDAPA